MLSWAWIAIKSSRGVFQWQCRHVRMLFLCMRCCFELMLSMLTCVSLHRKLHCTRNFIHMNLFVSFILRAISVFIKDGVLYAKEDSEHCFIHTVSNTSMPTVFSLLMFPGSGWIVQIVLVSFRFPCSASPLTFSLVVFSFKLECRAVMIFFHYCVLSNYFWLFIEGLYLFTLLVETFFPEKRYFYWYIIIGWGETSHFTCDQMVNPNSGCIVIHVCMMFYDRNPHGVCDHLGGAKATLWWYRVGYGQQSSASCWSSSDQHWTCCFIILPVQVLGHEWQCCHLVGDQGAGAGFNYGTLSLSLSNGAMKTILSKPTIDFLQNIFSTGQLCALHWHHHHPCAEATVPRYRRKWIQYLPVSHFTHSFHFIFSVWH